MSNQSLIFYVYILFDWLGIPRYVGKGKGSRWLDHEKKPDPINWLKNEFIEQSWIMIGEVPKIKVRENISEKEALATEIALIKAIGRLDLGTGPLTNMSEGGTGGDFGESVRRAKARWTPEERAIFAQTYREITIKWWANLTAEDRAKFKIKQSIAIRAAYEQLRKTDPDHGIRRGRKISEGQLRRSKEEKHEAALKALETNPPERRSKSATEWHMTRTPEERSETIRKGWSNLTKEQRTIRALGGSSAEARSDRSRRAQANLTSQQQIERSNRAIRLGTGTKWINNGIKRKRIPSSEALPEGWKYGQKLTDPEK